MNLPLEWQIVHFFFGGQTYTIREGSKACFSWLIKLFLDSVSSRQVLACCWTALRQLLLDFWLFVKSSRSLFRRNNQSVVGAGGSLTGQWSTSPWKQSSANLRRALKKKGLRYAATLDHDKLFLFLFLDHTPPNVSTHSESTSKMSSDDERDLNENVIPKYAVISDNARFHPPDNIRQ